MTNIRERNETSRAIKGYLSSISVDPLNGTGGTHVCTCMYRVREGEGEKRHMTFVCASGCEVEEGQRCGGQTQAASSEGARASTGPPGSSVSTLFSCVIQRGPAVPYKMPEYRHSAKSDG